MLLCLTMSSLMFAADTVIHYTTKTVLFDEVDITDQLQDVRSAGRGLSKECLSLKRIENFGFPCTINNLIPQNDYLAEHNEMLFLYHNVSTRSEIRSVDSDMGEVALLLPKSSNLSPYIDFRSSTLGIKTSCEAITPSCKFGTYGANDSFSGFYCSSGFWGSLGQDVNDPTAPPPDFPPLGFQLGPNMFMMFFGDEQLLTAYNPQGYNPSTGAPDPDIALMPDSELINRVWVAFALRFASAAVLANSDLSSDDGFFKGPSNVYDTVMRCNYESVLIDYTWFNGTVQDVKAVAAPNGTISELWHGSIVSSSVSGNSPSLQTMLKQAAVSNSSIEFANTWAGLHSQLLMASIGGVTSPRQNLLQQTRIPILVVKVWIPGLVFLSACCLCYIVAGCILAAFAVKTANYTDLRDAKARISIFGIVDWARAMISQQGSLPRENDVAREDYVIRLTQGGDCDYHFSTLKNA
jgi:hypothetical protein